MRPTLTNRTACLCAALVLLALGGMTPAASNLSRPAVAAEDAGPPSRQEPGAYRCPNHPQIHVSSPGMCPICMASLVPMGQLTHVVAVPSGGLDTFCRDYVLRQLDERKDLGTAEAYALVSAYVDLEGKGASRRLRELVWHENLSYVAAAAYWLGKLDDRSSVEPLRGLLASERLRLPTQGAGANADLINARLAVAGALHSMGQRDGLEALLAATEKGLLTYGMLALRDTPEVRAALHRAAENEYPIVRAYAIDALLTLGQEQYTERALQLLENDDQAVRATALDAIARNPSLATEDALRRRADRYSGQGKEAGPEAFLAVTAAAGMVRLGHREYLETITEAVRNAKKGVDLRYELELLGELGGPGDLALLRGIVENDPENRLWAVTAAVHITHRDSAHEN